MVAMVSPNDWAEHTDRLLVFLAIGTQIKPMVRTLPLGHSLCFHFYFRVKLNFPPPFLPRPQFSHAWLSSSASLLLLVLRALPSHCLPLALILALFLCLALFFRAHCLPRTRSFPASLSRAFSFSTGASTASSPAPSPQAPGVQAWAAPVGARTPARWCPGELLPVRLRVVAAAQQKPHSRHFLGPRSLVRLALITRAVVRQLPRRPHPLRRPCGGSAAARVSGLPISPSSSSGLLAASTPARAVRTERAVSRSLGAAAACSWQPASGGGAEGLPAGSAARRQQRFLPRLGHFRRGFPAPRRPLGLPLPRRDPRGGRGASRAARFHFASPSPSQAASFHFLSHLKWRWSFLRFPQGAQHPRKEGKDGRGCPVHSAHSGGGNCAPPPPLLSGAVNLTFSGH